MREILFLKLKTMLQNFSNKKYYRYSEFLGNSGIFLFFALVLSTKSGHSIAIGLILLASLLTIPLKREGVIPGEVKLCAIFLIGLALFWSHTFDSIFSFSFKGDNLVRYGLGALFIVGLSKLKIHPRSIIYGFAVGGVAAAVIASIQYYEVGRAEGYTNAIRFGNLNLLMGLACFSASLTGFFYKAERIFFLLSGFCLFAASILSLSRGGWLMFTFLPVIAYCIFSTYKRYAVLFSLILFSFLLASSILPPVNNRINQAYEEVYGYFSDRDKYVETSVGARLEMWRLAALMGMQKPLTGWGEEGIQYGRSDYVEKSLAHPFILRYNHAHNDFLQMWSSRGVFGVIGLLFIYLFPIYLIYKSYEKNKSILCNSSRFHSINKLFLIFGIFTYFGYFIFGLSDWFFIFVIGQNFYLFTLVAYLSAMLWIRRRGIAESSVNSSIAEFHTPP